MLLPADLYAHRAHNRSFVFFAVGTVVTSIPDRPRRHPPSADPPVARHVVPGAGPRGVRHRGLPHDGPPRLLCARYARPRLPARARSVGPPRRHAAHAWLLAAFQCLDDGGRGERHLWCTRRIGARPQKPATATRSRAIRRTARGASSCSSAFTGTAALATPTAPSPTWVAPRATARWSPFLVQD